MQMVILAGFVVALTLLDLDVARAPTWLMAAAVGLYVIITAIFSRLNSVLVLRAVGRQPEAETKAIRRYNIRALLMHCWLIGGLAGVMLTGYGRWVMEDLHLINVPLVGKLAVIAPFAAAVILMWLGEYPFYKFVRRRIAAQQQAMGAPAVRPGWTLGEYLGFNIRHHLLFFAVPISLIILAMDVLSLYLYPALPPAVAGDVVVGGTIVSAALVFLLAPMLIVRIWRTSRLGDGRLRRDLEAVCRQFKLRCRDILIWRSGGMIANAAVMGLIGPVRYVLLTDGLLENMDDRHIRSVFAHEAGHIVSHHILYFVLFASATATICDAAGYYLAEVIGSESLTAQAGPFVLLGAAWAMGFGWLSRRFERQSDVIAAWAAGPETADPADGTITQEGAAVFAQALQQVAQLNGIPLGRRNWRHGSIAWRIRYILQLAATGGARSEIDRLVRRIKVALWLALAAGLAAVAWRSL